MPTAIFAVVASHGSLMKLLRDGVWLAHDDFPGGLALFGKQEYPVIVVPPEVTGEVDGRLGTAIGVFTTTDWGSESQAPIDVGGRRYTHVQPARVTRVAPVGQGVAVFLDMVNRHALTGGDGQSPRLKRLSVAVSMATYAGIKAALRRIVRPVPGVLPGYAALAGHQPPDPWADVAPMQEITLPRVGVHQLIRAAVEEHDRRQPAPLRFDDDHNFVRRIAVDYLYRLAVDQVPDGLTTRIYATIAVAYPAFADECARQAMTP